MYAIPCVSWVKKGAAKQRPDRVRLSETDLQRVIGRPAHVIEEPESDEDNNDPTGSYLKRKRGTEHVEEDSDEDFAKRYGFENYDDEENENDEMQGKSDRGSDSDEDEDEDDDDYDGWSDDDSGDRKAQEGALQMSSLTNYSNPKNDPYLQSDLSDEDSDLEVTVKDNMIAVGKVAGDYFELRCYIYNEDDDNLYVHHDVMLPSFPLCLEWMDFDPGEENPGNFVALGSMTPDIQIWDLDVVDSLEPAFVLEGIKKKKSSKKKPKTASIGHTDAVLDLAWNHHMRKVLASASVDFTIGLWDLEQGTMVTQIKDHSEKVQALNWHPCEPQSLLSGSFDETVKVFDCRSPTDAQKSWNVNGEVEKVLWNHHNPFHFLVSTDKGQVACLDVRSKEPVFSMRAHQSATTGLAICSQTSGCLVTGSADKTIKVWDIRNVNQCKKVLSKNLSLGQLHCISASPDSSLTFFVGGERDVKVANFKKNPNVCSAFGIPCIKGLGREYGMEVQADESSSSEEERPKAKVSKVSLNKKAKKKKTHKKTSFKE